MISMIHVLKPATCKLWLQALRHLSLVFASYKLMQSFRKSVVWEESPQTLFHKPLGVLVGVEAHESLVTSARGQRQAVLSGSHGRVAVLLCRT